MHLFLINGGGEKAYFFFLCERLGEGGWAAFFFWKIKMTSTHSHYHFCHPVVGFLEDHLAHLKIIKFYFYIIQAFFRIIRNFSSTSSRRSLAASRNFLASFILSDRIRASKEELFVYRALLHVQCLYFCQWLRKSHLHLVLIWLPFFLKLCFSCK